MRLIVRDDDKELMEYYEVDTLCISSKNGMVKLQGDKDTFFCTSVEIDLSLDIYCNRNKIHKDDKGLTNKQELIHLISNSLSSCISIKIVINSECKFVKIECQWG